MSEPEVTWADSHVHLASTAFTDDVEAVIERARAAGARALVCIGESPAAAVRARALAARHPSLVHHTCGVHPHEAATWDDARDGSAIREAVALGAVAVGECGLDYHYDFAPRDVQRRTLDAQLALAAELQRPIVLHTRDAEPDTTAMLKEAAAAGIRGVLHCYTGSVALAEAGLSAGWFVSFSGIITLETKDNGQGFDVETALLKGGNGLKNIISRISELNGQVNFNSNISGTTVRMSI